MTDKERPLPAPLAGIDAHNALAAAVAMYQAIIADYQRREQLLQMNQARLLSENSMLRDELSKMKIAAPPESPRVHGRKEQPKIAEHADREKEPHRG